MALSEVNERDGVVKPASVTLNINPKDRKPITNKLISVFFADINFAADGGLYAELIQNRDFEYTNKDKKEWNSLTAWTSNGSVRIETTTLFMTTTNITHCWAADRL